MAQGDPAKWNMPGWRIEQRYSPGVLIGNWAEERYNFLRGKQSNDSSHRTDFKNYGNRQSDVIIRRKAQLQNEGFGKEILFGHHGNRYSNNMISWYDEHYNKRERDENNKLPDLRTWDSRRLAWLPEKSDHPIQGEPTNFGLRETLQSRWNSSLADNRLDDFETTYRGSYFPLPAEYAVKTRFANPRQNSTSLLSANKINKDLHLRNMQGFRAPEPVPVMSAPLRPSRYAHSQSVY